MKTTDSKKIQSAISRRYLTRFLILAAAWCAVVVLVILLGVALSSLRAWQAYDPLYQLLNFVRDYILLFAMLATLGGIIVILIFQWRHVARGFLSLTDTIQRMSQDDNAEIALPDDMREIQAILMQVQAENARNRRIAAEAEQRKNDLVVYLAHDLKTPLTSVLGYLTLLRDEKEISPELRQKYLDIAANKAMRLEDLINEFFEITRFSLKGLALEPTRLDLSFMLAQLASEFGPLFAPKNLACRTHIDPGIVMTADAGKLERVFDNLLRNAVSYSYPDSTIHLSATRENGYVTVTVQNSGDTIPAHKLGHLFEQFYRVSSARETVEGGSGLGLAIAREIVELHRGTITVQSTDNTIWFIVTLPEEQVMETAIITTATFEVEALRAPDNLDSPDDAP